MTPHMARPARLHTPFVVFLGSIAALVALVGLLAFDPAQLFAPRGAAARPLIVLCAASLKAPVEAIAREYGDRYGVEVQLQFGASNTLLATLEVSDRPDLYLPADDSYITTARDKNLVAEVVPLARQRPVLAVPRGNPKAVRGLDDVVRRNLRIAQANPEAAAVGRLVRQVLQRNGRWDAFSQRIVVTKPTVTDVAADVQVGAVDAGVVWDTTVASVAGLEVVPVPLFADVHAEVVASVARACAQPAAALHFARYLAARDRGLPVFAKYGFVPVDGDAWAETPELRLLAGAMLRPAIEETITAFEEREGVRVTRVYNGCGILVAQMRTGDGVPDAFFACDRAFMTQVHDLFGPPTTVSGNQLVILVHKGNPHGIRRLKDLAKPGLRVGVGHEKQCAMGVLTQQTLREDRSLPGVMKNVKVQSPTGDLLVNQMRTGSLDAAIAYISNAAGAADELEAVPVDIPCAFAEQPFAVGKKSTHPQLAGRLLDALRGRESYERFRAYGFSWKAPLPPGVKAP
ncbi:MAG: molybdate ABC transporter substrate-binding protein [Gemmataceae bacterium]